MKKSPYRLLAVVATNEWTDVFFKSQGIIYTEVLYDYAFLFYMEESLPVNFSKGRYNGNWRRARNFFSRRDDSNHYSRMDDGMIYIFLQPN